MILFGIFGAAIFGIIVDRTKRFLLIYKLCLVGTALSAISLAIAFGRENAAVHVAISVLAFGFFGLVNITKMRHAPVLKKEEQAINFVQGNLVCGFSKSRIKISPPRFWVILEILIRDDIFLWKFFVVLLRYR
jgi:predicted MFS family arabinose efflux permease